MTLSYIPSDTNDEGIFKATASGILPNGKPVIVNADGTVSVIAQQSSSAGDIQTFSTGSIGRNAVVHDTVNNKILIAYSESTGLAVVGTVDASAKTISFGSPVQFDSGAVDQLAIGFDPVAEKCLISYRDANNSNYGTAIVATISGTSVSFGTPAVFLSDTTTRNSIAYDAGAGKFLLAHVNQGDGYDGTSRVATISGTNVSFGTAVIFCTSHTKFLNAVYDPDQAKVGLFYRTNSNNQGVYRIGTISGTNVSYSSETAFKATTVNSASATYDTTNNKFVVAYSYGGGNVGYVNSGTSNGSSITFGTEAQITSGEVSILEGDTVFDESQGKGLVMFRNVGGASGALSVAPVDTSGSTPSFDALYALGIGATDESSAAYDSTNSRAIFIANNNASTNNGDAKVWATTPTNLTVENYIGISTGGTYASGSSATVKIIGNTSNDQSSLTAGQSYFVQIDGTIGTTAADPSVFAGTAISATKLIVKT
tara:strand:- start:16 stop:1464 length:1449 start_codon:yes stop_codon:yes gene_type:complete